MRICWKRIGASEKRGVDDELLVLAFQVAASRGCCSWCVDGPLASPSQAAALHEHRSSASSEML